VAARYNRASIVADEIRILKHAANQHNVVFVMGHTHVVLPKNISFWQIPRRVVLELPYKVRRLRITVMPALVLAFDMSG
jgi:hypothetical protein